MGFAFSERVVELNARLEAFMQEHIYPRERDWDEFTLARFSRIADGPDEVHMSQLGKHTTRELVA